MLIDFLDIIDFMSPLDIVNNDKYDIMSMIQKITKDDIVNFEAAMNQYFYEKDKLICAICAAPRLIAKRGYFNNLKFTIFPGCLETEVLGKQVSKGVVVEDYFITAKSMYYSIEFASSILKSLKYQSFSLIAVSQAKLRPNALSPSYKSKPYSYFLPISS